MLRPIPAMAAKNIAGVEVLSGSTMRTSLRLRHPSMATGRRKCARNVGVMLEQPGAADAPGRRNRSGLNGHGSPQRTSPPEGHRNEIPAPTRELGNNATLVLVLGMLLLFNLLGQWLLHLSQTQALEELIGPTALAVTVVYARSVLITAGKKFVAGLKADVS